MGAPLIVLEKPPLPIYKEEVRLSWVRPGLNVGLRAAAFEGFREEEPVANQTYPLTLKRELLAGYVGKLLIREARLTP